MKKTQAAAAATEQAEAQTSAPATDEAVAEQAIPEQPTAEQPTAEQAADPGAAEESVRGLALVDLPAYGLKCGEFGSLPYETARALWAGGSFDPRAIET